MKVLNKEIQDEARRRMEEGAMDSGDEWVRKFVCFLKTCITVQILYFDPGEQNFLPVNTWWYIKTNHGFYRMGQGEKQLSHNMWCD